MQAACTWSDALLLALPDDGTAESVRCMLSRPCVSSWAGESAAHGPKEGHTSAHTDDRCAGMPLLSSTVLFCALSIQHTREGQRSKSQEAIVEQRFRGGKANLVARCFVQLGSAQRPVATAGYVTAAWSRSASAGRSQWAQRVEPGTGVRASSIQSAVESSLATPGAQSRCVLPGRGCQVGNQAGQAGATAPEWVGERGRGSPAPA